MGLVEAEIEEQTAEFLIKGHLSNQWIDAVKLSWNSVSDP